MTVFRSENCHRRSRLPERGPLPAPESTSPVLESDPPSATSRSGPGAASASGRAGVSPAPCLLRPHAPSAERAFGDPLPPAPAPSFAHGPFAVRRCRAGSRLRSPVEMRDAMASPRHSWLYANHGTRQAVCGKDAGRAAFQAPNAPGHFFQDRLGWGGGRYYELPKSIKIQK